MSLVAYSRTGSRRPNNETRALFFSGRPRDWRMRRRTSKRSTDRVSIELKSPRLAYLPTEGMSRKYNRVIRGRCVFTWQVNRSNSPPPAPSHFPYSAISFRRRYEERGDFDRAATATSALRVFRANKKKFLSFYFFFSSFPFLPPFFFLLLFAINNIYYNVHVHVFVTLRCFFEIESADMRINNRVTNLRATLSSEAFVLFCEDEMEIMIRKKKVNVWKQCCVQRDVLIEEFILQLRWSLHVILSSFGNNCFGNEVESN